MDSIFNPKCYQCGALALKKCLCGKMCCEICSMYHTISTCSKCKKKYCDFTKKCYC